MVLKVVTPCSLVDEYCFHLQSGMWVNMLLQNADNNGPVNTISKQRKPKQSLPSYLAGQLVEGCIEKKVPLGNNREEITIYTFNVFLICDENRNRDEHKYNEMNATRSLHWECKKLENFQLGNLK